MNENLEFEIFKYRRHIMQAYTLMILSVFAILPHFLLIATFFFMFACVFLAVGRDFLAPFLAKRKLHKKGTN